MYRHIYTLPKEGFVKTMTLTPPGGRTWNGAQEVSVASDSGNILVVSSRSTPRALDLFSAAGMIIILLFQCANQCIFIT